MYSATHTHTHTHIGVQERLVRLLLDAGANIDAQSVNGGTPLMRAIETSQKEIVKLLIEKGCAKYAYALRLRSRVIFLCHLSSDTGSDKRHTPLPLSSTGLR